MKLKILKKISEKKWFKPVLYFLSVFILLILLTVLGIKYRVLQTVQHQFSSTESTVNTPNQDFTETIVIGVPDIDGDISQATVSVTKPVSSTNKWWVYPDKIYPVTRSGNDLLVLVNKTYKLPSTYVPSGLVSASTSGMKVKSSSFQVRSIIISDLKKLGSAAKSAGVDLIIASAYRSYATQQYTYNYYLKLNNYNYDILDTISARPGHSQHQLGTTVDISSSEVNNRIDSSFHSTKAAKWLSDNAWKYGFVISYPQGYEPITGYSYESWHYRYIGKGNAQEMKNNGQILEIYLRGKN